MVSRIYSAFLESILQDKNTQGSLKYILNFENKIVNIFGR